MTISAAHTSPAEDATEALADLESAQAERKKYLQDALDPRTPLPIGGLAAIDESIEVFAARHKRAAAIAKADSSNHPSADTAREILATIFDETDRRFTELQQSFESLRAAVQSYRDATDTYNTSIVAGSQALTKAGITATGCQLDDKDLIHSDARIEHGARHRSQIHPTVTAVHLTEIVGTSMLSKERPHPWNVAEVAYRNNPEQYLRWAIN